MDRFVVGAIAQTDRLAVLDVTESGTRPCRFDADRDKLARFFGGVRTQRQCFLKRRPICNDVIRWEDNHYGCMIAYCDPAGPERDCRRAAACGQPRQNSLLWHSAEHLSNCT